MKQTKPKKSFKSASYGWTLLTTLIIINISLICISNITKKFTLQQYLINELNISKKSEK